MFRGCGCWSEEVLFRAGRLPGWPHAGIVKPSGFRDLNSGTLSPELESLHDQTQTNLELEDTPCSKDPVALSRFKTKPMTHNDCTKYQYKDTHVASNCGTREHRGSSSSNVCNITSKA